MNPQLSVALTLSKKLLFQQMETITENVNNVIRFGGVQPVLWVMSGRPSPICQLIVKAAKLVVENKNGQAKIKDNKKIQKSLQACLWRSEVISKLKLKGKVMII